jgi:NTP pyrophosphatase (non-canonical NTP hydrolase)
VLVWKIITKSSTVDTSDFQKLAAKTVRKIDEKYNITRDAQLNLSQLLEELGELAKIANLEKLRNKKPERKELEDEFADVTLQLASLADIFRIDLEKAVLDKIEILKERHSL